jgi:hypothetical protein
LDDRNSTLEQVLKDQNGDTVALVRKDHLFLLNDLQKDERAHFLIKGLLFSMGFHGESAQKDSFFIQVILNRQVSQYWIKRLSD